MTTPTYTKQVKPDTRTQGMNIQKQGMFDQQALNYTKQGIAQADRNNQKIIETISWFAENELKSISERNGLIKAEEDQAIIDGYQEANRQTEEQIRVLKENPPTDFGGMDESGEYYNYHKNITTKEDSIAKNQQSIQELLKPGMAVNISDKVRIKTLESSYLMDLDGETTKSLNQLIEKFKFDPVNFEKEAKTMFKGVSEIMPKFKTSFSKMLNDKIARGKETVTKNFHKQVEDQHEAKANTYITWQENLTTTDAREGKDTTQSVQNVIDMNNSLVASGLKTQIQADNERDLLYTKRDMGKVLYGSDNITNRKTNIRNIPDDLVKYANDFLKADWSKSMDEDLKQKIYGNIINQAAVKQNTFDAQMEAKKKTDISFVRDMMKQMSNGVEFNNEQINSMSKIANGIGLGNEFIEAKTIYDSVVQLDSLPAVAQENQLKFIRTNADEMLNAMNIANGGNWSEDDLRKKVMIEKVYAASESRAKSNLESATKDINGYLNKNKPIFNGQVFDTKDIKKVPIGKDYTNVVNDIIKNRWDNRYNIKGQFNNLYESISSSEAVEINRSFSQMDKEGRIDFLQGLSKNVSMQESLNIITKMWKDNPSSELMAASVASYGDKAGANVLLTGLDIQRTDNFIKPSKDFKIGSKTANESILGDVNNHLTVQGKNLYNKAIMDYYYGMQEPGSQDDFDESLYETAVEKVTNGIIEFNGKQIFSPQAGYDEYKMDTFMDSISDPYSNHFEKSGAKLPYGFGSWDDVRTSLRTAEKTNSVYLQSVGRGKYNVTVKVIEGGVQKMKTVMQGKNTPFVLDFYVPNEDEKKPPKFIGN